MTRRSIPGVRYSKRRRDAKLDRPKIDAAWKLYAAGLSIDELAAKLWRRYGYASQASCHTALIEAFKTDGRKLRTRSEAAKLRLERDPRARQVLVQAVAKAREIRLARRREVAA